MEQIEVYINAQYVHGLNVFYGIKIEKGNVTMQILIPYSIFSVEHNPNRRERERKRDT